MAEERNFDVVVLNPAYVIPCRNMWLKALKNYPDAYYETYGEAYRQRENFPFWEKWFAEIENVQCAFGTIENENLTGIVRIIPGADNAIYDGQAVLSGLYYEGENPEGVAKLLETAKAWTADHTQYKKIMAAAIATNYASRRRLVAADFLAHKAEVLVWPATGKRVKQIWFGFNLDTLRPKQALKEAPELSAKGCDTLK